MKLRKVMSGLRYSLILPLLLSGAANASQAGDDHVVTANDSDGDRIVDTIDVDDDNDGIPDIEEIAGTGLDVDTDDDGVPNRLDLDSDNDGILDWKESGAVISVDFSAMRIVSGRILGKVGTNGFIDDLETAIDSGIMRYTLLNSDSNEDDLPDVLDLDSDNDGLPDLREAGVDASFDANNDARIDLDNVNGGVGEDGIADRLQTTDDKTCCDVNGDGVEDSVPRNTDNADLPDFQDLDSDNDGVSDLIESGGSDSDRNGRVDNFFDSPVIDGMDDAILLIPFETPDENGNAVPDFIDEFAQSGDVGPVEPATNTPTNESSGNDAPSTDGASPDGADATADRDPVPRPGGDIVSGPGSQPSEDDPATGVVNTGLSASGCSVQSTGIDLIVLLLSVFSIAILGWRYTIRRVRR